MPSKPSKKRRGSTTASNKQPRANQQPPVIDAQIQADSTIAAQPTRVQERPAIRRPAPTRRTSGTGWTATRNRITTSNPWLEKIIGAESPLWVTLLLMIPILVVFLKLTVGLKRDVLPFVDVDYFWHLATGEWVLDHHRVPTTDPYSWTYGGQEWIAHEWLAEVMLALSDRVGGYAGGIVLTTAIAAIGYWCLMTALRYYGLSRRAIVLLTLLLGGVFLRGWCPRRPPSGLHLGTAWPFSSPSLPPTTPAAANTSGSSPSSSPSGST